MKNRIKIQHIIGSFLCLGLAACNSDLTLNTPEEFQLVRIFHDDQALMCEPNSAIPVREHGELLLAENIALRCAQKGNDGYGYPEVCGGQNGAINIFTIYLDDLAKAESLGFSRLSELPDAHFDDQCEYKVISNYHKYLLLDQLDDNVQKWESIHANEYRFNFHINYPKCPTFVALPTYTIDVADQQITSIVDADTQQPVTDFSDFFTLPELMQELETLLKLTPFEAGLSVGETDSLPSFNQMGVPLSYYLAPSEEACEAIQYTVSDVEILSTHSN